MLVRNVCHGPVTVSFLRVRDLSTRTSRSFEFRDERALTVARDVGNPWLSNDARRP
jgi:hypothetical protein